VTGKKEVGRGGRRGEVSDGQVEPVRSKGSLKKRVGWGAGGNGSRDGDGYVVPPYGDRVLGDKC